MITVLDLYALNYIPKYNCFYIGKACKDFNIKPTVLKCPYMITPNCSIEQRNSLYRAWLNKQIKTACDQYKLPEHQQAYVPKMLIWQFKLIITCLELGQGVSLLDIVDPEESHGSVIAEVIQELREKRILCS